MRHSSNAPFEAPASVPAALQRIRPRLGALARHIVAFWLEHGPDREHGGFHGQLDRAGRPSAPTEKGVIQQARHLWAFSTWHERRGPSHEIAELCRCTRDLLLRTFRDPVDGLFLLTTTADGVPQDRRKLLYAQAFSIYGLSAHASAFCDERSQASALECFARFDALAHDAEHGGWCCPTHADEALRGEAAGGIARTYWLAQDAEKDTNTHIHVMEALTSLYELTADDRVGERLAEAAEIVAARLLQPEGYVHEQFTRDFRPVGPKAISYGHDIETAWLLFEAGRALGTMPAHWATAAQVMGTNAIEQGFDRVYGGLCDRGVPRGPVLDAEKVWWAQFEAIPGLFRLWATSGDAGWLNYLERVLSFIEGPARDPEHGEWYWGVSDDGRLGPRGDHKGELWKASYHNLRAVLLTEDWIRALSNQPAG